MFPVLLLVAAALAYYYMQKKTIGAKRLKFNYEYQDLDTSMYLSEDVDDRPASDLLTAYSPSIAGIERPTRGVLTARSVRSFEFIESKPNTFVVNNQCALPPYVERVEKSVFTLVPNDKSESPLSEVTALGDSFCEELLEEITTAKELEFCNQDVVTDTSTPAKETRKAEFKNLVPPDPATAEAQKVAKRKRKRNKKSKAQKSQQSETSSMENVAVDNFNSVTSVQEAAMELDRVKGTMA